MRLLSLFAVTAVAAVALPATAASAAPHSKKAAVHHFNGTVATVAKDRKSLRIKRTGKKGISFKLGKTTRGARRSTLKKGQQVAVTARKTRSGWVAGRIVVKKEPAKRVTPVTDEDDAGTDPLDDEVGQFDEELESGEDFVGDPGDLGDDFADGGE